MFSPSASQDHVTVGAALTGHFASRAVCLPARAALEDHFRCIFAQAAQLSGADGKGVTAPACAKLAAPAELMFEPFRAICRATSMDAWHASNRSVEGYDS